ncbi:NUDIX hydrolase [Flammeovirgaceae bacterium SG7u.111]|nr:NUDIX hydrolase [Flammeovirgaceae bacterium SG7u.132]WPO35219.1 NUDIX hydrolase [Flammeovirgaceae bacterium SG7u.111]
MSELKQLSSKVVYKNRWMSVREDKVQRPSGLEGIFGVVDKPDFVVIIPYQDGYVHLVEQYRYPVEKRFWEFPQGSWELETDKRPEEIAIGELKEETGLTSSNMKYVGHQYLAYGYSSQGYHIFLATDLTQNETELESEEEDLITSKFSIEEFEKMLTDGTIKDATTLCAYSLAKMKGVL